MTRRDAVVVVLLVLLVGGVGVVLLQNWWLHSQRLHCLNNLKILGEAVDGFEKKYGFLPASCIEKKYATWAVQIAPFLPEGRTGKLPDWNMALTYYQQSDEVRLSQVPWFYCPARRRPPQQSVSGDVPGDAEEKNVPGALGDYASCAGDGSGGELLAPEANGAMLVGKVVEAKEGQIVRWQGRLTKEDLSRGLSNTMLLGEKHVPWQEFGRRAVGDGSLYNGDYPLSFARFAGPGHGLAQTITEPVRTNFGSYHPRLCQFLMADGSGRPVATDVSERVLSDLIRR